MLKSSLLIALAVFTVQLAHADDNADGEPTVIRKGVYQKLGIFSGESTTTEEANPSDRQPAEIQPEQTQEDNVANQPRDTSDQPLTSQ
jgi:hypothetical protein